MGLIKNAFVSWLLKGADIDYKSDYEKLMDLTDRLRATYEEDLTNMKELISILEDKLEIVNNKADDMHDYALEAASRLEVTLNRYGELIADHKCLIEQRADLIEDYDELAEKYKDLVKKSNAAASTFIDPNGSYGPTDTYKDGSWEAGWLTVVEAIYDCITANNYIIGNFDTKDNPKGCNAFKGDNDDEYYIDRQALRGITSTFLVFKGKNKVFAGKTEKIIKDLSEHGMCIYKKGCNDDFGCCCNSPYLHDRIFIRISVAKLKKAIDKYND